MPPTLTTSSLPARDRQEAVRALVRRSVVRISSDDHAAPDDVRLPLSSFGPLGICSAHASPTTVRRTPRLAPDDAEPAAFVAAIACGRGAHPGHVGRLFRRIRGMAASGWRAAAAERSTAGA